MMRPANECTPHHTVEHFQARFMDEHNVAKPVFFAQDAKTKIAAWREEYNRVRPHSSLGYLTPARQ